MEQTAVKEKRTAKDFIRKYSSAFASYGGLIVCLIVFSVIPPMFGESIWTGTKLATLISDVVVILLLSVGAVFVYSMGHMDISIGRQIGLYATLMVLLGNSTGSLIPGIAISVVIAAFIAVINACAGQVLKIHPIVPSLVFMFVLIGTSTLIYSNLGTRSISLSSINYAPFKNPVILTAVIVIEVLIVTYLFRFTKFGKYAKAIGANELSAQQSGINLLKYKIASYMIMNMCVVLAAVFQMGYTGSASETTGSGYEMNVIVALILGGMPLSGGMKSRVSCAVVGAFTYSLLDVGLPLIGIPSNLTFTIKAVIFIIVVLITCRKKDGVLPR